jgi:hypothetical protein
MALDRRWRVTDASAGNGVKALRIQPPLVPKCVPNRLSYKFEVRMEPPDTPRFQPPNCNFRWNGHAEQAAELNGLNHDPLDHNHHLKT